MYLASISIELGKGAIKHNSRQFNTSNTNPERTHLNIEYANEDIKAVYSELFDESLERYNAKQKRSDRKITNYYEKISKGKQEKTFHEIVVQIGNKHDFGVDKSVSQLAINALDDYMKNFQSRNPYLRVFSAHLHLDEATPHLHIDFVPFTTNSKRGLSTRVSLKQALAKQGFVGNGREETEWALWVNSEKEALSKSMLKHDIEWENLNTNREHLSVLDYKKQEREKEVSILTTKAKSLEKEIDCLVDCKAELQEYDNDEFEQEFSLPEPKPLMTASAYKKLIEPMFNKLKQLVKSLIVRYYKMESRAYSAEQSVNRLGEQIYYLKKDLKVANKSVDRAENDRRNYRILRKIIGAKKVDEILKQHKSNRNIESKREDR